MSIYIYPRASLVAQLVKNLPTMQETWVRSLGWGDPLEKGKATHSSILARRISWTKSLGPQRVGLDRSTFTFKARECIRARVNLKINYVLRVITIC